ncbi:flavin reductase family protein [Fulvivirga lutimaris]|uniref:flavin reductase family protein n=1 Tax=Fulvivirga lutimaris TaxID=1819566 RepID=UPI0012BCBF81|nr:flavin reductase family protein [Fulvivirga lutimaris]MTI40770.1 flavin reductase family protein [Fulvivirga lutimaris]
MLTIDPKDVSVPKMHGYLLGAVSPRPIAFASTIDKEGNVNLSPFSFFNCFGANPPILIFSPARRGRDNTTKHTYENVLEVDEVVINIVNYSMVEQMSLASTEYPKGVNEFEKSGFTPVASTKVKPPRVAEAPVSFECKVIEVKPIGGKAGSGNLVICEVLLAHIKDEILDDEQRIDPFKLDAVARLGGNWYSRVQGDSIFEIPKPLTTLGIGVDQMPAEIRNSNTLTGNDLGRLANIEALPNKDQIDTFIVSLNVQPASIEQIHLLAKEYLQKGEVDNAWKILLNKW